MNYCLDEAMKVVVLVPAYNENKTIENVLERILNQNVDDVIVIDDGSNDGTAKIVEELGIKILRNEKNYGKGYSLRKGFEYILNNFNLNDITITIDADNQHSPEDIPRFVKKIEEGYDVVIGIRDFQNYPFKKRFGNIALSIISSILANYRFHDIMCGFQGIKNYVIRDILNFKIPKRYGIHAYFSIMTSKKFRIAQIRVNSEIYREGMKVIDGFKTLPIMIRGYINSFSLR